MKSIVLFVAVFWISNIGMAKSICSLNGEMKRDAIIEHTRNNIVPFLEIHPRLLGNREKSYSGIELFSSNVDFHSSVLSYWSTLSIKRLLPEVEFSDSFNQHLEQNVNNQLLRNISNSRVNFLSGSTKAEVYDVAWVLIFLSELSYHKEQFKLDPVLLNTTIEDFAFFSSTAFLDKVGIPLVKVESSVESSSFSKEYIEEIKEDYRVKKNVWVNPNDAVIERPDLELTDSEVFLKDLAVNAGDYDDRIFFFLGLQKAAQYCSASSLCNQDMTVFINDQLQKLKTYFDALDKLLLEDFNFINIVYPPSTMAYLDSSFVSSHIKKRSFFKDLSKNIKSFDVYKRFHFHQLGLITTTAWYHASQWNSGRKKVKECKKVSSILNTLFENFIHHIPTESEVQLANVKYRHNHLYQRQDRSSLESLKEYNKQVELLYNGIDQQKVEKEYNYTGTYHWVPQFAWRALYTMLENKK